MNLISTIKSIQQNLGVSLDGKPGPQTWDAIGEKLGVVAAAAPSDEDLLDPRSETNIATLLPEVQPYARALVHAAAAINIQIKIISGTRTYAEQDALYAKGRTTEGPIVTNARGGQSNHNFGIAFDVGVFEGKKYLGESPKYKAVGALGMQLGLSWGGSWTSFNDEPHYELKPEWAEGMTEKAMVAALRDRKAKGMDVFA
jgi:peptidoglycan LD-endopeptidase CwlK